MVKNVNLQIVRFYSLQAFYEYYRKWKSFLKPVHHLEYAAKNT